MWVAHTWGDYGLQGWLCELGVPIAHLGRVQEWDIAYFSAAATWGLVVHAGTGSWVQCRTPDGRMPRIGGMGPFLGDEGGGWDLGFRGIKAALRSDWSHKTRTSLADEIPRAMGVPDLRGAVVGDPITSGKVTRAQIASIAPIVLEQAAAGDSIAMQVVDEAAESLADMCAILLEDTKAIGQGYPLIGVAGVIQSSPFYWRVLQDKILLHDATLAPEVAPYKMAVGAAMLAMKDAGVSITQDLRDRIVSSQAAYPFARVPTLTFQSST